MSGANTEINKELVDWAYKNLSNIPRGEEYEKMISGVHYDCFNKELWLARNLSTEVALDYSNIRMKDHDYDFEKYYNARNAYLKKLFGKIEDDLVIEAPFYVDYGCNTKFGKANYFNFNLTLLDCTLITFGDNVMAGPNVTFTTATHPTDPTSRLKGEEMAFPISVGNNVWFGSNIVVLPGVNIGDGCVVGAGSVVTKDVPAYSVVVGNPARVLKKLTPEDNIEEIKSNLKF
ncbi:hypothetical protein FT663_00213 [Candidozyma haemuli var. vulneris]|uniref:Maltose/galactoside acetyltransferase domain-containing protein n=1 Tax=Candidozyma haemuli TaxID=45357 RepID=A0A2V1ANA3_9ASCO|nr:hypothetical protein CXQ85_003605 [[Candida] haemuloni]KAF3993543.1 hypothetical protein FT662_00463 [[Candida] haemuloni var. vulneris]KAF3995617.1 hypothetical protein FT663_00213 [[Candida] haemuloni var. vulneris]PVH19747.1 hypothetical protein CXQ85_003605 [[Candida] haemuloni]